MLSFENEYEKHGLHLVTTSEKGRHVLSQKEFQVGEIVYSGSPYVSAVHSKWQDNICSNCFKESDPSQLARCSQCKKARYCSKDCQKIDWKLHKEECNYWKTFFPTALPLTVFQIVARLMIKKKLTTDASLSPSFSDIIQFESHLKDRSEDKQESYKKMALMMIKVLNLSFSPQLQDQIQNLFSQVNCNALGIMNYKTNQLGSGIYPFVAMFNHSCSPNCIVAFRGTKIILRAIKTINVDDEITFAYIDINDPSPIRQKKLLEEYFFKCNCDRCQKKTFDNWLVGYRCKNQSKEECSSQPLQKQENDSNTFQCGFCGYLVTESELLQKEGESLKMYQNSIVQFEQKNDLKGAIDLASKAYSIQSNLLFPYNRYLQDTRFKLFNFLSLLNSDSRKVIEYLHQNIDFLQKVGHPYQIVIAVSWHRIVMELQKSVTQAKNSKEKKKLNEELVNANKQCLQIYSFIFGSDDDFVKSLQTSS